MKLLASERGSALVVAIALLMLLAMIPVAMQMVATSAKDTQAQIHQSSEADNAARAGLQDAISWFQRQQCQPVRQSCSGSYTYPDAAFSPTYPTDTLDATCSPGPCSIGLVNEFALDPDLGLWARYEVREQPVGATNASAVHDVTTQRVPPPTGAVGGGLAWYIQSKAYIYWKRNPALAYNVSPNQVVGNASAATELRRLAMVLPANAGLIVNNESKITLSNNGRVVGGTTGAGIGYYTASATPPTVDGQTASNNPGTGSYYTGTPSKISIGATQVSDVGIFGMSQASVKLLADYVVPNVAALPSNYPHLAVVYIDGNADFCAIPLNGGTCPQLLGSGILYVNGSLTIESTNNALFSGLIFATGPITLNSVTLSGAVISSACSGAGAGAGQCNSGTGVVTAGTYVTVDGTNGASQVTYDNTVLNSIRNTLANYREDKAAYYTFSSLK